MKAKLHSPIRAVVAIAAALAVAAPAASAASASEPVIALPTVSVARVAVSGGAVPVTLGCPGDSNTPCEGFLSITPVGAARPRVFAASAAAAGQRFEIAAGARATIPVRLDAAVARRLHGSSRTLRVAIEITLNTPSGSETELSPLTLRGGHARAGVGAPRSGRRLLCAA